MSEINWDKIQRKLEGKCECCGGELPQHIGVCPVYGEKLNKQFDRIDKQLDFINDTVSNTVNNLKKRGII